jgi:hypothetical protein
VAGEQNLEQIHLEEEIAELLPLLPCIVDSIGRMLHSHRKPRMDLGRLPRRHSTGHIEQHSRLQLLDSQRQVLKA